MPNVAVKVNVLELYSGIGGMHYSLQHFDNVEIVAAVDISPLANSVYRHNFPNTNHLEKGVEGLRLKELDNLNFNMLLMSPPCQPFTRVGMKRDKDDPRTKSFFYLLDILKKLKNPPAYILLENVKGFEESKTFLFFKQVLSDLAYQQQGFMISPKQLGIPNSRLRYYHLAVREPLRFNREWFEPDRILDFLPHVTSNNGCQSPIGSHQRDVACKPLREYLRNELNSDLILPQRVCERYLPVMDVVSPDSTNSTCFTKSYGHYVEGTGSILKITSCDEEGTDVPCGESASGFQLRYFSCREIANLMGFPERSFSFPTSITTKQRYRLLGNSLNVHVVSELIKLLLDCDGTNKQS